MAAVAGTAGGLYLVMNQDLSHGEGHGGHGAHHDTPVKEEALEQVEAEAPDAAKEEAKEETKEAKEEIPEDVKEGKRDSLSDKKAEKEEDVDKNAKPEAALQGQSDSKPSETDKVSCIRNLVQWELTWHSLTPAERQRTQTSSQESRMRRIRTRTPTIPLMWPRATTRARRARVLRRLPRLRALCLRSVLR
jgi:hypothetical protein